MRIACNTLILIALCVSLYGQCEIDSAQIINSEWYKFYKSQDQSLNSKILSQYITVNKIEFLEGNIHADFNPEFSECNREFIKESPDKRKYTDFLSYNTVIEPQDSCRIIGFDIDQEVDLIDRNSKTVKRIRFAGSNEIIEDAIWIGINQIVLFIRTTNSKQGIKLYIECYNFDSNQYTVFAQSGYYKFTQTYIGKRYGFKA